MDVYTESSGVDTSPDMNSSVEISSPDRMKAVLPRKLTFGLSPEGDTNDISKQYNAANLVLSPRKQPSISPPYRRVRALRLFDTPATPKTIMQKSTAAKCPKFLYNHENANLDFVPAMVREAPGNVLCDRPRCFPLHNQAFDNVMNAANINPFTPNSLLMQNKKRSRTQLGRENLHNNSLPTNAFRERQQNFAKYSDDEDLPEVHQAPKRLALQDSNISRYAKEFVEISLIGVGEFGLVYQCLNRLDGCVYAIKKSIKPVAGSSFEKTALNEVWAHAVLGKHDNVVRYYSAWAEDNHMLIQNEYCNGGSLQAFIQKRFLVESELRTLLLHIAEGLKYIHSNGLVHMDLKSGNIFLTKVPARPASTTDSYDDGFEDVYDEVESAEYIITYKIGDLGHVTSVKDPQVEEGDCRYLPKEILQEDFKHLFKADIFSLGMTLYEAAGGGPLPKNGPEWHKFREGDFPDLPNLSKDFNSLIKLMTHPDPECRPSSTSIFNHAILNPIESKTKAQLSHELAVERQKNELLLRKLKEAKKILKSYEQSKTPVTKRLKHQSPTVSDRQLRSYTRKTQRPVLSRSRRGLRDKNKNVIDDRVFSYSIHQTHE
ncbi:unnamed protein product [Hermetia illucens]|uniref:Wee1-like protein kinase n=1 Tax=Hermetia illucens TaxID=343691 RepID=A0A7R8USI5_HERIL|nr:wee1-like protein kinase [Hermetia illucens]CAD7086217.1 unnamed protein product [Hermetia illucens]